MKNIKSKIAKMCVIMAIIFTLVMPLISVRVEAHHIYSHLGDCPPGTVGIPNSPSCGPASVDGNGTQNPFNNGGQLIDEHGVVVPPPNPTNLTETHAPAPEGDYTLLAPLSDKLTNFNTQQPCAFGEYLDLMINLFIGICAVLAMVMIVVGGIEYMTSELGSSKEHGKSQMTQAVLGLLLALGAWLILHEINPHLLDRCLDLPDAKAVVEGDEFAGTYSSINSSSSPLDASKLTAAGIFCPKTGGAAAIPIIAKSYAGKVTYNQAKRGTTDASTIYLDCSSFVKQVYECAGLDLEGSTTLGMLPGKETITKMTPTSANDKTLLIGDVLGWIKGESAKHPNAGHVVIYIGGGTYIEVTSGLGRNGAVRVKPVSHYITDFRHVVRVNPAG